LVMTSSLNLGIDVSHSAFVKHGLNTHFPLFLRLGPVPVRILNKDHNYPPPNNLPSKDDG